jgi:two-component system chemotaxis sensor kinase CheA
VAVTHDLETLFDKVRSGKINATHEIIDLTLQARDQIKAMLNLNAYYVGGAVDEAKGALILSSFKRLLAGTAGSMTKVPTPPKEGKSPEASMSTKAYRIRFRRSAEVFVQGNERTPSIC